jgi:hypothetical protein
MKTRMITKLFALMGATMLMASCDDHYIEDYSWHSWQPGMVYCTNGEVASYEKCVSEVNTPEAVLFYIDRNDEISGIAYAVSLKDSYTDAFSNPDTICVEQGTSADITACDGEANTTALRYGRIESPIAQNTTAKYFIPSVGEMYKLYAARAVVNGTVEKCGGTPLPIDNEGCWYWTSTECDGAKTDRAWRFSLFSGRFESTDKHTALPVRPIMMIRLNKEEQQ